jgi:lipopolysaccharide heptosyltransferase I
MRSALSESDLRSREFQRILLIKPSSLGDVVHALPVLHGLRRRYPNARIDWLISSSLAPLLEGHPDLNELVLFDRRRYGRMAYSPMVVADFVRFIHRLRMRRYDLAIDLQGLFRTGFLARAGGAPIRIGFANAREGAPLFYNHRVRRTAREQFGERSWASEILDIHAVDRNYSVARLLGFEDVPIEFHIPLSDDDRASARWLLRQEGWEYRERLVAVVPGARWETKVWLPQRFAATIDELQSGHDVRCVLLGGPDETARCEQIAAACRNAPINLAGQTSLRTMAAVLAKADAVLCHDSGAMHVAVALDRRVVCLVGPTNPARTGPYRRPNDVVRLDLDCAPCYLRKLSQCRFDHRCMKELAVTPVVEAVRRSLQRQ